MEHEENCPDCGDAIPIPAWLQPEGPGTIECPCGAVLGYGTTDRWCSYPQGDYLMAVPALYIVKPAPEID